MKKYYFIILLVSLLTVGISLKVSANVIGIEQIIKDKKVTINVKDKTLDEILMLINEQTKIGYGYQDNAIDKNRKFSLTVKNTPLQDALTTLLKDSPYTFKLEKDRILIAKKGSPSESLVSFNKKVQIDGKVMDYENNPIIGATVIVEGTARGGITDNKGAFTLMVNSGDILEVSCIGFVQKKLAINNSNKNLVIHMEPSEMAVDDVIVTTGYTSMSRNKSAGAITSVKMDEINAVGINSIDKLLEGRIPGLIFTQNSGQVGATPKLRIRGTSTILGNQEPLWVVDGIIQHDPVKVDPSQLNDLDFVNLLGNAISGLNPDDVEQIDVLKDAAATAIYGARAANGVIVITTRKGKEGPPRLSYTFSGTFTQRPRYSDKTIYQMNSQERVDVSREMFEKGANFPKVSEWIGYEKAVVDFYAGRINSDEYTRLSRYYETINTDWFDILTQNSFSNKHTISLSGGTQHIKYYASVGYNDEKGVTRKEKLNGITTALKINGNYEKYRFQFGMNANSTNKRYTPNNAEGINIVQYAYETSRAIPAYNPDGSMFFYDKAKTVGTESYPFNFENEMNTTYNKIKNFSYQFTGTFGLTLFKGMEAEFTASYTKSNNKSETTYEEDSNYIAILRKGGPGTLGTVCPFGGELNTDNTISQSVTGRVQLNYNRTFVDKHNLMVTLGGELSSTEYNGMKYQQRGYYPGRGKTFALVTPGDLTKPEYSDYLYYLNSNRLVLGESLTNMLSAYFAATYTYDSRYTINFNTRMDGSNQFGSRSREKLLPIWSIAGRWDIKQDFFKESDFINAMALKLSYGHQGNMLDNQTDRMIISKGIKDSLFDEFISTVVNYPNPDLKWETTSSYNAELYFSIWKNKIGASFTYYYKKTQDAFLTKSVSTINGVKNYVVNDGQLTNQGMEISLNITAINQKVDSNGKRGFVWRFDPQIGQALNKLVNKAINNKTLSVRDKVTYGDYLSGSVELRDRPLNTFFSYRFKGLDPTYGYPTFYGMEAENKDELYEKYKNMEDEEAWMEILEESGTRVPVFQGGFSNYFGYRQFGLSCNFTYSFGNKIRLIKLCGPAGTNLTTYPEKNLRRELVDRWRNPGDEATTNIPGLLPNGAINKQWWSTSPYNSCASKYTSGDVYSMYDNSDMRVVSGDYFKLQSISFRYNFHTEFCRRLKISSAYLSVSGTNIFTVASSKLVGQDVTQSGTAKTVNISLRPTYSMSLNISF